MTATLTRDQADNGAAIRDLSTATFAKRRPRPSGGAVDDATRPRGAKRRARCLVALNLTKVLAAQTEAEIEAEATAATMRASLSPEIRKMLAW
jgi:hypothetical protein